MCVLLFIVFKHLLLKKTDVLVGKINFSETKFEQMHKLRRAKRYKVYLGKPLFLHYYFQFPKIYWLKIKISKNWDTVLLMKEHW